MGDNVFQLEPFDISFLIPLIAVIVLFFVMLFAYKKARRFPVILGIYFVSIGVIVFLINTNAVTPVFSPYLEIGFILVQSLFLIQTIIGVYKEYVISRG